MIDPFLEWLGATPWSIGLLESFYLWPILESSHVVLLALFVGTAVMMDLRLIGIAFRGIPASAFLNRMLPWTRVGFALMVTTGVLLFYSNPVTYWHNLFFRIKVVLLVLGGLNVWFFHRRTHASIAEWDDLLPPPRAVRLAGVASLVVWTAIVFSGRMIAYNWFQCDIQPQSDFVNWAAGCDVEPVSDMEMGGAVEAFEPGVEP